MVQHRAEILLQNAMQRFLKTLILLKPIFPENQARTGNHKIVRATKGAAIAYKTRVYQHMWDWNNVIVEAQKLIALPAADGYSLTAAPDGPFTSNYSNT